MDKRQSLHEHPALERQAVGQSASDAAHREVVVKMNQIPFLKLGCQ